MLAGNNKINAAAEGHVNVLMNGKYLDQHPAADPHNGVNDGTPATRMQAQGYVSTFGNGQYHRDENVGAYGQWPTAGTPVNAGVI